MASPDILDRRGRVVIDANLTKTNFDDVQAILGQMLIVEAVHHFQTDTLEYWAYSEHFDPLPANAPAPTYSIEATQDGEETTVEFVRQDG